MFSRNGANGKDRIKEVMFGRVRQVAVPGAKLLTRNGLFKEETM